MKLVAIFVATLILSAPTVSAPVIYNLNFTTVNGPGKAAGTFIVDDSDLGPNVVLGRIISVIDLLDFQMHIQGLATTPQTTSFDRSDLTGWLLTTDSTGKITDVNFFMDSTDANDDGYSILGQSPFVLALYDGPVRTAESRVIAHFEASPTQQAIAQEIPTGNAWALVMLTLMIAAIGAKPSKPDT